MNWNINKMKWCLIKKNQSVTLCYYCLPDLIKKQMFSFFFLGTVVMMMFQWTAQAAWPHKMSTLWSQWGPVPCARSQIINLQCSDFLLVQLLREGVCVFPSRGPDPAVGYHSSSNRALRRDCQLFSSGLILLSVNVLLQKRSNELWLRRLPPSTAY